jgi:hypothetical protein
MAAPLEEHLNGIPKAPTLGSDGWIPTARTLSFIDNLYNQSYKHGSSLMKAKRTSRLKCGAKAWPFRNPKMPRSLFQLLTHQIGLSLNAASASELDRLLSTLCLLDNRNSRGSPPSTAEPMGRSPRLTTS